MTPAAEAEIKRLLSGMDGPASFEPTIRAAMLWMVKDIKQALTALKREYAKECVWAGGSDETRAIADCIDAVKDRLK